MERLRGSPLPLLVKNVPASRVDIRGLGLTPGSGRSPEGGHSNPLQYACLENLMDGGTWWATEYNLVHFSVGFIGGGGHYLIILLFDFRVKFLKLAL